MNPSKNPMLTFIRGNLLFALIVAGAGELAATGSSAPNNASSFHAPLRKTYEGRCIAILRPTSSAGKITLKAEADGWKAATIEVQTR